MTELDIGFVGEVTRVNPEILQVGDALQSSNIMPNRKPQSLSHHLNHVPRGSFPSCLWSNLMVCLLLPLKDRTFFFVCRQQ